MESIAIISVTVHGAGLGQKLRHHFEADSNYEVHCFEKEVVPVVILPNFSVP